MYFLTAPLIHLVQWHSLTGLEPTKEIIFPLLLKTITGFLLNDKKTPRKQTKKQKPQTKQNSSDFIIICQKTCFFNYVCNPEK